MNYEAHYDRLISRARTRVNTGYVEVHHVLPRCMGGTNDPNNLVALTAEEHFVAHQLLCKMHPTIRGLAFAAQVMTASIAGPRVGNKLFGWLRRRYAQAQKGRPKSAQERANIAEAGRNRKPRVFSEQARANMLAARILDQKARKESGLAKAIGQKTSDTRRKNGSYVVSAEQRRKIGLAGLGRAPHNKGKVGVSDVTRAKMREAKLGKPSPRQRKVEEAKVYLTKEELSAVRKAASLAMWEKRRQEGTLTVVGQAAAKTRRANGNYGVNPEVRARISESLKGNQNRTKNLASGK